MAFNPHENNRPNKVSGLFSGKTDSGGSNNPDNPDNGGGGEDSLPKYDRIESVEETQKRLERLEEYMRYYGEKNDWESSSDAERDYGLFEVKESYKDFTSLDKLRNKLERNPKAVKNLEKIKTMLSEGADPSTIGYRPTSLGNNFYYIRKGKIRIVMQYDPKTKTSDIAAVALRSDANDMRKFANAVNDNLDTKIDINTKAY